MLLYILFIAQMWFSWTMNEIIWYFVIWKLKFFEPKCRVFLKKKMKRVGNFLVEGPQERKLRFVCFLFHSHYAVNLRFWENFQVFNELFVLHLRHTGKLDSLIVQDALFCKLKKRNGKSTESLKKVFFLKRKKTLKFSLRKVFILLIAYCLLFEVWTYVFLISIQNLPKLR